MAGRSDLAILGGRPVLEKAPPFVWPPVRPADAEIVADMVLRGELSYYGREGQVRELEDRFRDYLGVRHALATSSGTTALHSAYFGLGLRPGDEVLAPTYTFLATVMPLLVANAVPVLVDAEPDTGNLDPVDLEARITERTRAVVVTHMAGNPVDMHRVLDVARRHRLKVIEDCSHAHGAEYDNRKAGTFGDVAVFSLQGKKLVSAGQGGILVTNDQEIFERAVLLGHFNVRSMQDVHSPAYRDYAFTGLGLNYRMHALAAALAVTQMDRLEEYIAGRRHNMGLLSERLEKTPGIVPPTMGRLVTRHVYYGYRPLYRAADLGDLPIDVYVDAVRAEGVPLERYVSSPPLHLLPIFGAQEPPLITHGVPEQFAVGGQRRSYRPGDLPVSEGYADVTLSLPTYTEPDDGLMEAFGEAFRKVADHADDLHALACEDRDDR
ncbi:MULTISPECIES: DegT/DnrJ/EryC1/StrS family aminotransferase [Actinoplanes]|uniref:DegT/DnrJ/EryC1/StrS family aminotransferase n=1 Tax=Actinoplanes TaxID=1865 RepID=UPI0005F2C986|nr:MULTISPECIES: DegT/DnrJ/EryC1/StrS family aminotransferase [Actinoplanes]GLY02719.1 hypothetical protein Acsp01_30980 [Actinoplanes sp. NBRC 101535]